jgi:hypothetical protein
MKRKQGQRRHSYLITFLVALKQRFWARREASPQCKKQHLRRCLDPIILVVDTSSSSLFELRMPVSLEFRLCSLRHFAMAFFRLPHLHMKQTKGLAPLKPQRELRRELPHCRRWNSLLLNDLGQEGRHPVDFVNQGPVSPFRPSHRPVMDEGFQSFVELDIGPEEFILFICRVISG